MMTMMTPREEMEMKQSLEKMNVLMDAARREEDVGPKAAEDVLNILDNAINEIYKYNATSLGFEELYSKAFFMVWHNFGEMLYIKIASTVTFYIKQMAASIEASEGPLFLEELNKKWLEHSKAFNTSRCIFMCMDRRCTPNTHKAHVLELGVQLWVDNVIHCTRIQTRLKNALLEIVQRERDGEVVCRDVIRSTLKMLMDLGPSVYEEMFEMPLLDLSTTFYRGKSQQLIECYECAEYLKKVEKCLNEEKERLSDYLGAKWVTKTTPILEKGMVESHKPGAYRHHPSLVAKSIVKITNVVEKEMMESYMARLINSGLVNMIVNNKYDDLAVMYNLFQRVPDGLRLMRGAMTLHIQETGKQLVTDPESLQDSVELVQHVLEEKDKLEQIINFALNNDITFRNALNSSFEYFINLNPRFLEFISFFVGSKLRKGVNEDDLKIVIDKVMKLTGYLHEKDVLEKLGKLTWQTNLGSAAIIATVGIKHQLNIATHQMCVLMLFNNADRLSYKEIEEAVKIPTLELKACLQSLACAEETSILKKEQMRKDVCEDDVFFVNEYFKVKVGSGIGRAQNAMSSVDNGRKGNLQHKLVTPICMLVTSGFLVLQIVGKFKRSCNN